MTRLPQTGGVGVGGGPVPDADTTTPQAAQAHGAFADHAETAPPAEQESPADPESVARSIALRRLTGSPQTRHQLDEAMAKKGVPVDVRTGVLDRFTEVGLIDDAAYAAAWVESRQSARGLSARALADELRRRGVDADLIQEAVRGVQPEDEEAAARALVRRKLATMARLDPATRSRRLIAMLGRKGYSSGLAFRIVRELVDEAPDESFDL